MDLVPCESLISLSPGPALPMTGALPSKVLISPDMYYERQDPGSQLCAQHCLYVEHERL